MVVILQQSTDNGNKFVSTVVDTPQQESSYTSGFSLSSQVSISERSAVYKQRIDSLFGRPSPATTNSTSSSSHHGEPFHIRIDGKSVSPTTGLMGSHRTASSAIAPSTTTLFGEENEARVLTASDSDDYSRMNDKVSIVTDSLDHRSSVHVNGSRKKGGQNGSNVSSVRITCDDSESSGFQLQSLTVASSSSGGEEGAGQCETSAEQIMWRNSNFGQNAQQGNSAGRVVAPKPGFNTLRCSPGGMLKFSVDYLGSVPVKGNTAALQDLQAPLRTLYLNYLTNTNMMSGQLAITSDGLRFEAPIRLVNPFTTIAVWAAVKFVGRGEPIANECAFMPLISDPEGQDKSRLFGKMNPDLSSVYNDCVTEATKPFKNPPIFACVMREATFSLSCHAFACKCAEDAIVIAANLYQSLVSKMRTIGGGGKEGESGYGSLTRGSSATQSSVNQNRSSSAASSVESSKANGMVGGIKPVMNFKPALAQTPSSSSTQNDSRAVFSDSESIAPIRPPRKKKKVNDIPVGNLKRYNSDDSVLLKLPQRRRSFKTGYQGHYIKNKKRVQIHTPDDDDSSADSLSDSVDQILDRIVNPCGMSFADLKPPYQELLLKIALTLTQDQVYKKSKHAMKKQQQKLRKKGKPVSSSTESTEENAQFMNNFFKSISKISLGGKTAPIPKRPGSGKPEVTFRSKSKPLPQMQKAAVLPSKAILKKSKEEEVPFMSFCSGCACDKCSDKCYCSLLTTKNPLMNGRMNQSTPTTSTTVASTPTQHPGCSSNADTDVPRSRKSCGYDTDSCAESEKCYCSLQRIKSNGLKIYNINLDTETSDTDTNSYDLEAFNISRLPGGPSNSAVVKPVECNERPVEILSYHPSRRLSYCFSPTSSQKSYAKEMGANFDLERRRQNPSQPAANKKNGKESDIPENPHLLKNKILLITGSNACGQVVYKDAPFNFKQVLDFSDGFSRRIDPAKIASRQELLTSKSQEEETPCCSSSLENKDFAPERVLSMKKTAEIAAMFTDLKLDPSKDFVLNGNADAEELGHDMGSIDFETSLGYLP